MTFSTERAGGAVNGPYKSGDRLRIPSGLSDYTVISEDYGFTLVEKTSTMSIFEKPRLLRSRHYSPNQSVTVYEDGGHSVKIIGLAPNQPAPESNYLPPLD